MLVLALLPILTFAQNKAILKPGGQTIYLNSNEDAREVFSVSNSKYHNKSVLPLRNVTGINGVTGTIDTLDYNGLGTAYTSTFGGFGQDVLVGWFVAPADLTIKSVGFDCGDNPAAVSGELKLYKVGNGWTVSKLKSITTALNLGYWIAKGNGFNDIAPFEDEATEPKTWVAHSANALTPFVEDIWSDAGTGAPVTPADDADRTTYQWVEMNLLGFEPEIKGGEIFAIILKNADPQFDLNRFGVMASTEVKYGLFKYYANGRTSNDTSTAGWWKREYLLNIAAAVDITGDTPPTVSGVKNPRGTLDVGPMEITATLTDINPGGGPAGIKEAFVIYSTDKDTAKKEVAMAVKSGNIWAGSIPGQEPATWVYFKVKAADMNDNVTFGPDRQYFVFGPTAGVNTLLVFNGYSYLGAAADQYPQNYYFGIDDFAAYKTLEFKHDIWAYGPLSKALVDNYTNIIEIAAPTATYYTDAVYRDWLAADAHHNLMIAGQEWLGARYGYADSTFGAGSFEYDIFGITHSYNDVSYDGTAGQNLPSKLTVPNPASIITGPMLAKFNSIVPVPDSLNYDPYYEINTSYTNWIDGFDVVDGQAVDLQVETRGVLGAPKVETLNCATHRELPAGNKIVFLAYDPLSVNTRPNYYWLGFSATSPQDQVLTWFGVQVNVEKMIDNKPNKFALSQNYPNPFNPATTISFSVPERSSVSLKIYDMLGKEVLTLINGVKDAGSYEFNFDASKLTSGLYVYTLTAGNFTASKKMMLLK